MATKPAAVSDRYRWVALTNTTASMFMATLDGSIVIIALPAIFRGIGLDPLAPGSIFRRPHHGLRRYLLLRLHLPLTSRSSAGF
jgi:hypothetical protein